MTIHNKTIGSKIEGRTKKTLATGLLVAGMMAASLLAASPAHASTTFIVNESFDAPDLRPGDGRCDAISFLSGDQCTLRAAIEEANTTAGADAINFDIPGTGVQTIEVGEGGDGALPAITQTVTIDGYTQPGARPNTKAVGDDAVILIELNGAGAGSATGLNIDGASNSVIRGLAINRFSGSGIVVFSGSGSALGNRIEGNFVGTDPSGKTDLGNGGSGVLIQNSSNNTVGGTAPAARNLVSGNNFAFGGVRTQEGASGNRIQGNYIGTDRSGTEDLGNFEDGVSVFDGFNNIVGGSTAGAGNLISGNDRDGVVIGGAATGSNNSVLGNRIGTTASGAGPLGNGSDGVSIFRMSNDSIGDGSAAGSNTIAFNGGDGVTVTESTSFPADGNRVLRNAIFSNAGQGIDLGDDGATANDAGDADTGANNLQNFPVLSSARVSKKGTKVAGTLNSTPGQTFTVQFFSNPSGTGQGQTFLGQKSVTTDSSGNASFSFKTKKKVPKGQNITATATDSEGNTSEFSGPRTVTR